jgi:hypothetical protein
MGDRIFPKSLSNTGSIFYPHLLPKPTPRGISLRFLYNFFTFDLQADDKQGRRQG